MDSLQRECFTKIDKNKTNRATVFMEENEDIFCDLFIENSRDRKKEEFFNEYYQEQYFSMCTKEGKWIQLPNGWVEIDEGKLSPDLYKLAIKTASSNAQMIQNNLGKLKQEYGSEIDENFFLNI